MPFDQFKLTWLHLSDIHFGHGRRYAAAERDDVLEALLEDVLDLRGRARIPPVDQIVVSGDIAYSGGALLASEYEDARRYLLRVGERLQLGPDAVLVVPGNHDVDRRVAEGDDDVRRLLAELRQGGPVEEALASPRDTERLVSRFAGYQDFAQNFGAGLEGDGSSHPLFWSTLIDARDDLRVRIAGGNSALLSQGDDDEGKLQLGLRQLREILQPGGAHDVSVLITHHPLDWMRDAAEAEARVERWADLHLCGHVHRAESRTGSRGGGSGLVRIVAGATHEFDTAAGRGTGSFTYSVTSLYRDAQGSIWARIWPRRWVPSRIAFRVDPESVPDGHTYVDHLVRESRRGTDVPATTDRTDAVQRLWKASERSVRRIGARRTAYPLDMNIAELHRRGLYVEAGLTDLADRSRALTLESLCAAVRTDQSVLILGEPGSGKSVTSYAVLEELRRHQVPALALRPSDLPEVLAESGVSELTMTLRQAATEHVDGVVLVVDGLDEGLGEFDTSVDLAHLLRELGDGYRLVVTCRRREFEDQLARFMESGTFDVIVSLDEWTLEGEFTDFVSRLVTAGLLDSPGILEVVRDSPALVALARRPLFARMLTFLGSHDVLSVNSLVGLYGEYMDKLSAASDSALRSAGCVLSVTSQDVWVGAAWLIFSKGMLIEERFSLNAIGKMLSADLDVPPRCLSRALSQLCDQWRVAGRVWARFVHYSFFEYLVARYYLDQVNEAVLRGSATDLANMLALDLTPEIRHFLADELRAVGTVKLTMALVSAYQETRTAQLSLAKQRTTGNLIAYLLSRAAPEATGALRQLFGAEQDMFLQQSLLWGLCHLGDADALAHFIAESRRSAEWRAWNRGYLMYYYGDLDRREDPPYVDADRAQSWGRTRERSIDFMSAPGYNRTIKAQRRYLDLYSLYDYALWRDEKLPAQDTTVAEGVLAALWDETGIAGSLLHELQAMHAAAAAVEA
jgi:3',5'-cyclic AMP phosphodiesterase CpdA